MYVLSSCVHARRMWKFLIPIVIVVLGLLYYLSQFDVVSITEKEWSCDNYECKVSFIARNTSNESIPVRFYFKGMNRTTGSSPKAMENSVDSYFDTELSANSSESFFRTINKTDGDYIGSIQITVAVRTD